MLASILGVTVIPSGAILLGSAIQVCCLLKESTSKKSAADFVVVSVCILCQFSNSSFRHSRTLHYGKRDKQNKPWVSFIANLVKTSLFLYIKMHQVAREELLKAQDSS